MKVNGKQLDRFIMREMNNLLKESQSWDPRPAITKHGIQQQSDINGELSSVILQGIKTVVGDDLSHPGESEEFLGELRLILDNNPDVANKLYDVFMTIRTGGGFDNEWYEERHQMDQELGEPDMDQALDQLENEDPEDWSDEKRNISEAVTKYGIQPQGRINGEIADIIIRGIKEVTGATSITGRDVEGELRNILNREHDSTNDIWDLFMAVKSSLIDGEEETGLTFSGPEGVGGLDWSFDNTADGPIKGGPDEDLA